MKISTIVLAGTLGTFMALSAQAETSKKDREFLSKAAAGGMFEVEAGKLAEKNASIGIVMAQPKSTKGVPHSSGRNTFATWRTLILSGVVIALLLVAMWVPW